MKPQNTHSSGWWVGIGLALFAVQVISSTTLGVPSSDDKKPRPRARSVDRTLTCVTSAIGASERVHCNFPTTPRVDFLQAIERTLLRRVFGAVNVAPAVSELEEADLLSTAFSPRVPDGARSRHLNTRERYAMQSTVNDALRHSEEKADRPAHAHIHLMIKPTLQQQNEIFRRRSMAALFMLATHTSRAVPRLLQRLSGAALIEITDVLDTPIYGQIFDRIVRFDNRSHPQLILTGGQFEGTFTVQSAALIRGLFALTQRQVKWVLPLRHIEYQQGVSMETRAFGQSGDAAGMDNVLDFLSYFQTLAESARKACPSTRMAFIQPYPDEVARGVVHHCEIFCDTGARAVIEVVSGDFAL